MRADSRRLIRTEQPGYLRSSPTAHTRFTAIEGEWNELLLPHSMNESVCVLIDVVNGFDFERNQSIVEAAAKAAPALALGLQLRAGSLHGEGQGGSAYNCTATSEAITERAFGALRRGFELFELLPTRFEFTTAD